MTNAIETKGIKVHELKAWPQEFYGVRKGEKTAEFRNNDRNFREGDLILLREYLPTEAEWTAAGLSWEEWIDMSWVRIDLKPGLPDKDENGAFIDDYRDEDYIATPTVELPAYTGETELVQITHVQTGFGIPDGYVVLSVAKVSLR